MSATLTMERERNEDPSVLPFALTLAVCGHGAIALLTPSSLVAREVTMPPLEVELVAPQPPPPPPPVPAAPAEPDAAPRAVRVTRADAAIGKLLTRETPSVPSDAPLDFVTDPNGATYGFGVVSRAGSGSGEGTRGTGTAEGSLVRKAPAMAAPALAAPADLSEKPHLLAEEPCRGYYPEGASVDFASAVVRVVLEASGKVRDVTLVSETPEGEGFGAAARRCLRQQRFSAGLDHEGRGVATATTIRVRFER